MASSEELIHIQRSTLPDEELIAARDVRALNYKKIFKAGILTIEELIDSCQKAANNPAVTYDDDPTKLEWNKRMGPFMVDAHNSLPVVARDPINDFEIGHGSQTSHLVLHMRPVSGKDGLRDGLRQVAKYVGSHEKLWKRDAITAVTYKELGNVVTRTGFECVEPDSVSEPTLGLLGAIHDTVMAINRRPTHPVEPVVLYTSMDDFLERYY